MVRDPRPHALSKGGDNKVLNVPRWALLFEDTQGIIPSDGDALGSGLVEGSHGMPLRGHRSRPQTTLRASSCSHLATCGCAGAKAVVTSRPADENDENYHQTMGVGSE